MSIERRKGELLNNNGESIERREEEQTTHG